MVRSQTDRIDEEAGCRPADCPGSRKLELPVIDEARIAQAARLHKALADETRLKILEYLESGELCVCELLEVLDMPQSTVSHHLLLLQNAGLIRSRKQGRWVLYSRNPVSNLQTGYAKE